MKHLHEIPKGSPPAGALNTGGVWKFPDFLLISRYISRTMQDIAIVTTKANRKPYQSFWMASISITSNPDFKVTILFKTSNNSKMVQDRAIFTIESPIMVYRTPFFDTVYLTNGYRYGHSYYRRRIGNRTQAFEWHQFQWHWVNTNPDFKVTILFNIKKLENGTR